MARDDQEAGIHQKNQLAVLVSLEITAQLRQLVLGQNPALVHLFQEAGDALARILVVKPEAAHG